MKRFNYLSISFITDFFSKGIDIVVKLLSVPILIKYYGIDQFGLIALVISFNIVSSFLDNGFKAAGIKQISKLFIEKKYKELWNLSTTSIFFYFIIGILNSVFLVIIFFNYNEYFEIIEINQKVFETLLVISIFASPLIWISNFLNQILIATKKISIINNYKTIQSITYLFVILISIYLDFSISLLFLLVICNELILNFLKILPIINSKLLIPQRFFLIDWNRFKPIFNYSLKLLSLSFFLLIASKSRPMILAVLSPDPEIIVGNYRIMETLMNLPIAIVGSISSILFPKAVEILKLKDKLKRVNYIYNYLSLSNLFAVLICLLIISIVDEFIFFWVGSEYSSLTIWIKIWCLNAFLVLFKSPLNSFLLMKGDLSLLVKISFFSCITMLLLSFILFDYFNLGSVIISYLIYVIMVFVLENILVYNSLLGLNSFNLFKKMVKSMLFLIIVILVSITTISKLFILNSLFKIFISGFIFYVFFGKNFFISNYKFLKHDI